MAASMIRGVPVPVVDVHCHVFNADDLPVRGFVQRLHLSTPVLGPMLATVVDRVVQGGAPSYADDKAELDRLLAGAGDDAAGATEVLGPRPRVDAVPEARADGFEREVDAALERLVATDPAFVRRLSAALAQEAAVTGAPPGGASDGATAEGWGDALGTARRAVAWARLFATSRHVLAARLAATYGDVDLFCPLLVDLGGLGDVARTSVREQVELLERISRLSMLGRLPGAGGARFHPFVGFDPRRHVRAVLARADETPFDVVRWAVERQGFVGVKVYPPMGFRPLGNTATVDMTPAEADRLDEELRSFYGWCQAEQVPIVAHANRSNAADPSFADFAGPTGWNQVLREFPDLHVDLGHFGGAARRTSARAWPRAMARLCRSSRAVYADTGNHRIDDAAVRAGYLDLLAELAQFPATDVRERLMYGSDWFMLAVLPDHERFLDTYRTAYRERFTTAETAAFVGGNALRFLGFHDAGNRNAARLLARYRRHAPDRVPDWLAS